MATKDQVVEQIRFALSQLRTRNGHHEFEELSRYLARQTIVPNILPATGPVAAGGDQGRDFETFRSFVEGHLTSGFVGVAESRAVAFTCTLQASDVAGKIRDDVAAIAGSGTSVGRVFAFIEADFTVGARHSLQDDIHQAHGIELEVIDGTAIAELLAEPKEFWIAERFLNVPAEIYPEPVNREEWYGEVFDRWQQQDVFPPTHGVFTELKGAVRQATAVGQASDIEFWIERLRRFAGSDDAPTRLRRAAMYEIFVASLMGLGSLVGQEGALHEFFEEVEELDDPIELSDASVLLMFILGARQRELVLIDPAELLDINRRISARADHILGEERSRAERAILLHVQGFLAIQPNLTSEPLEPVDAPGALDHWLEAVALAKETPVFPVRVLSDQISIIAPLIASESRYRELIDEIDALVAERMGQAAAGEKCRDRAVALHESGQILRALDELHQAKIDWFGGDTLRGSLLAMLFIGRLYSSLGLDLAAKYHFLAAAYGAANAGDPSLLDLVPAGLLGAADADYQRGAWRSYLRLIRIGLRAFFEYAAKADPYSSEEFGRALFYLTLIRAVCELHRTDGTTFVDEIVAEFSMEDFLAELYPTARAQWEGKSEEEFVDNAQRDLFNRPFSDGGETTSIRWNALGVEWNVEFQNDCETEKVAERLVAMLQIFQADLADADLSVLPTRVVIRVDASDDSEADARFAHDGEPRCEVRLPRWSPSLDIETASIQALSVGMVLLLHVSTLPEEEVRSFVEESFKGGISHKIAPASTYDVLVEAFTPCERDPSDLRGLHPMAPSTQFVPPQVAELAWKEGPGPRYTRTEAEEMIRNRYRRFADMIPATLPALSKAPSFQTTVARLRGEGWPDWQILSAVANLAFNTRQDVRALTRADMDRIRREGPSSENVGDLPLPAELFSYEQLQLMRRVSAGSVMSNWGLELHSGTADIEAVLTLLTERYGFMSDDVEHDDPFK